MANIGTPIDWIILNRSSWEQVASIFCVVLLRSARKEGGCRVAAGKPWRQFGTPHIAK
jgi:hypothetical protein